MLLSQRTEQQALPLKWELPGGKVELGESPVQALRRELREELDVEVDVGPIWDVVYHAYPSYEVVMLVYRCELTGGRQPRPVEVRDVVWVPPQRWRDYDVLPADLPLLDRLRSELPNGAATTNILS